MKTPDHCWVRIYSGPNYDRRWVVGYSDHQDAWALYSSAKDKEGWRTLQLMGGAFEDPKEGMESADKAMKGNGYKPNGEWKKEAMEGAFEF